MVPDAYTSSACLLTASNNVDRVSELPTDPVHIDRDQRFAFLWPYGVEFRSLTSTLVTKSGRNKDGTGLREGSVWDLPHARIGNIIAPFQPAAGTSLSALR